MKVIRNVVGWDIAFDMTFTDKQTADMIAKRIAPLLPTLIRDVVDSGMRVAHTPTSEVGGKSPNIPDNIKNKVAEVAEGQPRRDYDTADENAAEADCASTCPTPSIVSRVRKLGISPFIPPK